MAEPASFSVALDNAWWQKKNDDDMRHTLLAVVKDLEARQNYRRYAQQFHMRLYGSADYTGYSSYNQGRSAWRFASDRLTFNLVASVIDTAVAKIAKNKTVPRFLTEGGDWSMKRKAQALTKFIKGEFYRLKIYETCQLKVFKPGCIFGTGFLHVFQENGRVAIDWIPPNELKVDDDEAIYGRPRSAYRVKIVNKEVLVAQFPQYRDQIMDAPRPKGEEVLGYRADNQVKLTEAWHLPSKFPSPLGYDDDSTGEDDVGPVDVSRGTGGDCCDKCGTDCEGDCCDDCCRKRKGKSKSDGRHVLSLENVTLVDEEYERDEFPWIKWHWKAPLFGYWGTGLAFEETPLQVELNKTLQRVQDCIHLVAVPRIFKPTHSNVNDAGIANAVGLIIPYDGDTPPTIWAGTAVPPDLMNHVGWIIKSGYELAGISQMSAQGQKPEGLDSGKALREFSDIEAERFAMQQQSWEQFYLEVTRHIIWNVKDIVRQGGEYVTHYPDKKSFLPIDWNDIDLEEDQYVMQNFPTSMLSDTFAGRIADVQDLINIGAVDQAFAAELLQFPDLESEMNLQAAGVREILRVIEQIMEHGKYEQPDPLQNLTLGTKLMMYAYNEAKQDGLPQERLNMIQQWISTAKEILMPPAPPMPPGPPPGAAPSVAGPPSAPAPGAGLPPGGAPPMPGPAGPPPGIPLA